MSLDPLGPTPPPMPTPAATSPLQGTQTVPASGESGVAVATGTVPADATTSSEEMAVVMGLEAIDVPGHEEPAEVVVVSPTVVMGLEAVDVTAHEEPAEVVVLSPTVVMPAVEVGNTAMASTSFADPAKLPATTPPVTNLQGVLRVPPSASQFLDDIERNAEEQMQIIKLLREIVEVIIFYSLCSLRFTGSTFIAPSRCSPRVSSRLMEIGLKLIRTNSFIFGRRKSKGPPPRRAT